MPRSPARTNAPLPWFAPGLEFPRLYVIGIQPEQNRVTVGPDAALLAKGLIGERLHWIGKAPALSSDGTVEATVRIRSRHAGVRAHIRPLANFNGEGRVEIQFAEPQRGVTPGQAAVFYQGTRVLGGCWIEGSL